MKFRRLMGRRAGFNLVEVMVALAVLAIILTIAVLVLRPFQLAAKSRDARRLEDIGQFQIGLELYYKKYGMYPCGDAQWSSGGDKIGVDSSLSLPFLDGNDGVNDSNYCPAPGNPSGLVTEGYIPVVIEFSGYNDPLLPECENLPEPHINDPNNPDTSYRRCIWARAYWYFISSDRRKYVLTARLENDDEKMYNDGGSCLRRYEVGNGLPLLSYADENEVPSDKQGQCAGGQLYTE